MMSEIKEIVTSTRDDSILPIFGILNVLEPTFKEIVELKGDHMYRILLNKMEDSCGRWTICLKCVKAQDERLVWNLQPYDFHMFPRFDFFLLWW